MCRFIANAFGFGSITSRNNASLHGRGAISPMVEQMLEVVSPLCIPLCFILAISMVFVSLITAGFVLL
jgi:hypothetical protein